MDRSEAGIPGECPGCKTPAACRAHEECLAPPPPAEQASGGLPDPKYIYHPSDVDGEDDLFEFADAGAVDEGCDACERLYTADQVRAILTAALSQRPVVDEVTAWRPISEAPTGKLCIVGWQTNEAVEYPDRHDFDFIEDGRWVHHDDNVDHADAVAPPGSKMPPRDPPYQWFIEVPDFPAALAPQQPEKGEG